MAGTKTTFKDLRTFFSTLGWHRNLGSMVSKWVISPTTVDGSEIRLSS